jgi:hypothetical protein
LRHRGTSKAIENNATVKLMEDVHSDLVEEFVCRERIDQEETIAVEEEVDDWNTEGESSEEKEEENCND